MSNNLAYIYYSVPINEKKISNIPTITFTARDASNNIDGSFNNLNYYDFSLFKYSVFVQTARNNNLTTDNNNDIDNFSHCYVGKLQVYPKAFKTPNQNNINNYSYKISNEINGDTHYPISPNVNYAPNGRLFYSNDIINNNLATYLTLKCKYENNMAKLMFDFEPFNNESELDLNLIYSIQVELIHPGKLNMNDIHTLNFNKNIN